MSQTNRFKTIVIYNYNHAYMVMKAASKLKKKIYISSPPNAASYMGPIFFKKILEKAKKSFPDVDYNEILDCSNDTGLALEAIHYKIKNIKLKCSKIVLRKIKNICKKNGLSINNIKKKRLDLKNVENVYDECLKWLNK